MPRGGMALRALLNFLTVESCSTNRGVRRSRWADHVKIEWLRTLESVVKKSKSFIGLVSLGLLLISCASPGENRARQVANDENSIPLPSFQTSDGRKIVPIDIQNATYKIVYNIKKKKAMVFSTIKFTVQELGYPFFDSVEVPQVLKLNDNDTDHSEESLPEGLSKIRIVDQVVAAQNQVHTLEVQTPLVKNVKFDPNCVESLFSNLDMRDRNFLEQYLPTNLEFDQYKMSMEVVIEGANKKHEMFTNGAVETLGENHFSVDYPDYLNSSGLYFHLAPVKRYKVNRFNYESIDGRKIPITIYAHRSEFFYNATLKIFKARTVGAFFSRNRMRILEKRFGPWPHSQLVVYAKQKLRGGMEYAGAAESSHGAYEHELVHNFFGRSVFPVNGDAGWIDEAIASWNDFQRSIRNKDNDLCTELGHSSFDSCVVDPQFVRHYQRKLKNKQLVSFNKFKRNTNRHSYVQGRYFLTYLDHLVRSQSKGKINLNKFLKFYHEKNKFKMVDAFSFQKDLEEFTGFDYDELFQKYIY